MMAVVANSVTAQSDIADKTSPDALMEGYRATFFFCLGLQVLALIISVVGLRKIGNVGHKRD